MNALTQELVELLSLEKLEDLCMLTFYLVEMLAPQLFMKLIVSVMAVVL